MIVLPDKQEEDSVVASSTIVMDRPSQAALSGAHDHAPSTMTWSQKHPSPGPWRHRAGRPCSPRRFGRAGVARPRTLGRGSAARRLEVRSHRGSQLSARIPSVRVRRDVEAGCTGVDWHPEPHL